MSNRVFLVGLPGSGKSTIAPLVAARLGWPWVDLDREIAARAGVSIPEIFARGETEFRQLESATLAELTKREPLVVATGGGVVLAERNRALIRQSGVVVALRVTPVIAAERLADVSASRPLLQADPLRRLRELHQERAPFYGEADLAIETDDAPPARVAQRVLAGLAAYGLLADGSPPTIIPVTAQSAPHEIIVGWGVLAQLAESLAALHLPPRLTIITDVQVAELLLPGIVAHLEGHGWALNTIIIPAGETSKSLEQLGAIYDDLIAARAERGEAILALGGGVVGDLAGFAAATYLRGVPLVQVPTTLLAQVDAAIGGKTGINHPLAKNAIGAFYQPRAVLVDPAALLSLDDRLLREGWGEIVKYAITLDAELFAQLATTRSDLPMIAPRDLASVIARCARLKARIVSADEREAELRLVLNYGHTIGHALEATVGYGTLLHGEAVFLGMAVEARIAERLGIIPPDLVARLDALIAAFAVPIPACLPNVATILAATRLDKKTRDGRIRWVLPTGIGTTAIRDDVPAEVVAEVLRGWLAEVQQGKISQ